MTLVKKYMSEKPVDKLEETNPELSKYSSISTLTNLWIAKRLWQRKNRQKLTKRRRFPPSLLSSRAADFWDTLMPLRANCSCSSVSVSDKCSRLSFGVSISDATVGSNLAQDSSVPLTEESTIQKSLGDTLEHTHLAFELLIARMVRLLDTLNEKLGSSLTEIWSDSDLKTFQKSKKSMEMIAGGNCYEFSSVTSLSSSTSNHWSVERSGKKWESLTKFELADEKKRLSERGFFSRTSLLPKNLRAKKTALTKEELVYLLECKKSLVSDYFRSKVDLTDLKRSPDSPERISLICETQSDSRLQERNLLHLIQFIKARKREDDENLTKINFHSLGSQKSNTNLLSELLNNDDGRSLSIPKRRVTFSDPLPKKSISLLNYCSSGNEDGIFATQSSTIAIGNDSEIPNEETVQSNPLFVHESPSPLASSVSLRSCFANLSLKSLSTSVCDPDPHSISIKLATERIHRETKNAADKTTGLAQSKNIDEMEFREKNLKRKKLVKNTDVVSAMTVDMSRSKENEALSNKPSSFVPLVKNSSEKSSKSKENVKMMKEQKSAGLELMGKEILDRGTTHVSLLKDVAPSVILEVDDATPPVTFEERSPQNNLEKCLKKNVCPIEIRENCSSLDNDDCTLDLELKEIPIRKKVTRFSNVQKSEKPLRCNQLKLNLSSSTEQHFVKTYMNSQVSCSSGKTVTFQDCCKIMSEESILSNQKELEPDDTSASLSNSKGRFDFSWKGCWEHQGVKNDVQKEEQVTEGSTNGEERLLNSNTTEVTCQNVAFIPIETYGVKHDLSSNNHELSSGISESQTSYYTTMEDEIQLANNDSTRCRSASPSPNSRSSNIPSFREIAASLEQDEIIPWTTKSEKDSSKSWKPVSKTNSSFNPNPGAIKSKNHTNLQKGLTNVCQKIRYPEIWRSEVRPKTTPFYKSDWYTGHGSVKHPWKTSDAKSNWLIQKLAELQLNPPTDYESDYYAGSEAEPDCKCDKDLSLIKKSFSNLDTRYKNWFKFNMKRNRLRQDLFLNKVWSNKKIIFNECRCHKNPSRNRLNLRPRESDLRHAVFPESDQLSDQNFISHLRARLILDSETDDSDFGSSIRPDFYTDFKHKDDHVNKIKYRRFVKSLKSIRSEEDRQFSSSGLLRVTFKKSFSPASVQSAFSTRTVGTSISKEQNFPDMKDVCIDTCDLCPCKTIETKKTASDLEYANKTSSCQTKKDPSFEALNSFQSPNHISKTSSILTDRTFGPDFSISRSNYQKTLNALANLSTEINTTSNNLAKSRFSDIKSEPEKSSLFPTTRESTPSITSHFSPVVKSFDSDKNFAKKFSEIPKHADSFTAENSRCTICDARKKPTGRYVLPPCIVQGADPDQKTNKKDPWNRVMEQAKAQHRYDERQNTLTCLETKQAVCSARVSTRFKSFERRQTGFLANDQSQKEEVRVRLVQVKDNSSQVAIYDLEYSELHFDKMISSSRKDRRLVLSPASALFQSTSRGSPIESFPKTRSPQKPKKPKTSPNMSNRLLYVISESTEVMNQIARKSPVVNLFAYRTRKNSTDFDLR